MKVGHLTVRTGLHEGLTFHLKDLTVFEIGRASGSHLKLRDVSVSMNHCRIYRNDDHFTIYALSTSKPTLVNGRAIEKAALAPGDTIEIGDVVLDFDLVEDGREEAPAEEAPAEAASPSPPSEAADLLPPSEAAAPDEEERTSLDLPPGTSARLVVIDGQDSGAVMPLAGKTQYRIGRAANSDFRLTDGKVSRDHCIVENSRGHHIVIDLESANGTVVNGERIRKTVLRNGDYIRLGYTILRFDC